jgi:release factor glutamine methyltransferase
VTIREALRTATERLELHHVSNARLTAELLLAHTLSVEREYLYAHDDRILLAEEDQALEDHLYDRIGGVPLQYIVGRQEFYGRYFAVSPAVLIPRPETEYIVEAVLEFTDRDNRRCEPLRILDVGTGSGCIAITAALEIPGTKVFATDISEEALRVASRNASRLHADVQFACMDVLDGISGKFDFIVSNPPYVRRDEMSRLQREVREHEPHVALFSPEDELAIYRRLIECAERLLTPGGCLIMEVGLAMDERVMILFDSKWDKLPAKADLQGIPRTVLATLRPTRT